MGAQALDNWPYLSPQVSVGIRSQRDIMTNVSIDQLPTIGVELNKVLSGKSGNETEFLQQIRTLLSVGVQTFVIDLEPNNATEWLVTNTSVKFTSFLSVLKDYASTSNNNLSANMLVLLLRFSKSKRNGGALTEILSQANFTSDLYNNVGSGFIYSPDDLKNDRQSNVTWTINGKSNTGGWPTLDHFLYQVRKRLIVATIDNLLNESINTLIFNSSILNYQTDNTTADCPITSNDRLTTISLEPWRFLESDYTPQNIKEFIKCGHSPIISNRYDSGNISEIMHLLDSALLWSWNSNQPLHETMRSSSSTSLSAYNCAVLHYTSSNSSSNWEVANCYDKKPVLCRYMDRAFVWTRTDDEQDYFSIGTDGTCPDGYQFTLPRIPFQLQSVENYLKSIDSPDIDMWIDLNSISVSDCWVSGGPYASCPYQKVVSKRSFAKMISPVSVFSFALLVMVIYLNWLKTPIQDNRKGWKKVVNSYSKSEFEGVPS